MRIPRFWSTVSGTTKDPQGKLLSFKCSRSSNVSESEARSLAENALQSLFDAISRNQPLNGYEYGKSDIREQLIEEIRTEHSQKTIGAITRNSYGALILNTTNVFFADIDCDLSTPFSQWFKMKFFGTKPPEPFQNIKEREAYLKIEKFFNQRVSLSGRLYRTPLGLRLILTHEAIDPESDLSARLFDELEADPLYVRLCKSQKCYRARLTPKPWRIGMNTPPPYPFSNTEEEQRFQIWLKQYESRSEGFAGCRILKHFGSESMPADVATIVEIHDRLSGAAQTSTRKIA